MLAANTQLSSLGPAFDVYTKYKNQFVMSK